jgi:hypothetical protein
VELGFELRDSHLPSRYSLVSTTPPVHFALVTLEMGLSQSITPGYPWTVILPISASQVARITGVNHWSTVSFLLFFFLTNRVMYFCLGQSGPQFCYLLLQCRWNDICAPSCPTMDLNGVQLNFCPSNPPNLCLLRSWDYRCEQLCPARKVFCFVLFYDTGDWTQGLTLARQALYHLSYSIKKKSF